MSGMLSKGQSEIRKKLLEIEKYPLIQQYSPTARSMSGTVLGSGDIQGDEADQFLSLWNILVGDGSNKVSGRIGR